MSVTDAVKQLQKMKGDVPLTVDITGFLHVYLEELKEHLEQEGSWDGAIACMAPPEMCIVDVKDIVYVHETAATKHVRVIAEDFIA